MKPAQPPARVGELGQGLSQLRSDAGLPAPQGAELQAVDLKVTVPIDTLAVNIADLLKHSDGRWGIFRYGDDIVKLEQQDSPRGGVTVKARVMTAKLFRMWLPRTRNVVLYKSKREVDDDGTGRKEIIYERGELSMEQSATVLESGGPLWQKLPVLRGIQGVKMPMWTEPDENGHCELRLLKPGFDPVSGIYTVEDDALDYDENVDPEKAFHALVGLFFHFGWRNRTRDLSIHLATIFALFGRDLFLGKAPMSVYNANQQDSGKTRLATWVSWLIYGTRATLRLLRDQDKKLEDDLIAAANSGANYTLFDNVDWGNHEVKSVLLDQWIDGKEWQFRKMHTQNQAAPLLNGLTMMTGNNVKLSADLQRRSLIVDILNHVPGSQRDLPLHAVVLDDRYFENNANRCKALSWVWALLKAWDAGGRVRRPGRSLGSFEGWSEVIPSVVWYAGHKFDPGHRWDCLQVSENEEIGDKNGRQLRQLAEIAVEEFGKGDGGVRLESFEVTVAQLAGVARRHQKATWALYPHDHIESVLQTEGTSGGWKYVRPPTASAWFDPEAPDGSDEDRSRQAAEWLNPKSRSGFGGLMKKSLHEKYFAGADGVYYQFMHREGKTPACYLVTKVSGKR